VILPSWDVNRWELRKIMRDLWQALKGNSYILKWPLSPELRTQTEFLKSDKSII